MQLTSILIIALSAGALAFPSPNVTSTDSSRLSKRGNYGWLSSFQDSDTTCSGLWGGSRPKVHEDCIKFSPISDNVGINWGRSPLNFNGISFYSDDKCQHQVGSAKVGGNGNKKGSDTCVSVKKNGGPWGSLQGTGVYFD